jgi:hypothetical protein
MLDVGTRVTVKLDPESTINNVKVKLVNYDIPLKENGLYWGYKVKNFFERCYTIIIN